MRAEFLLMKLSVNFDVQLLILFSAIICRAERDELEAD